MNGKWPALALILATAAAGFGVWYTQEYAYYAPIEATSDRARLVIVARADGQPRPLGLSDFEGIDGASSPIRFRACFVTDPPEDDAYMPYPDPQPLIAPGWFGCFDAARIGADLASGVAVAYLSVSDIRPDVDRVVAIYPDGRGYAWHQINQKNPERGVMD